MEHQLDATITVFIDLQDQQKRLLLHLVGVPYYFTYIDDARSYTNQVGELWLALRVFRHVQVS
jgi:hypothetical protein